MTAKLIQLADAVVEALNDHDFGVDFTAERSYADWDLSLSDSGVVHVDVVPVGHPTSELDTRSSVGYQLTVDVGIRKRFTAEEQDDETGRIELDAVDEMVELVELFVEFFYASPNRSLADADQASIAADGVAVRSTWIRPHLKDKRQFTALMRLTYDYSHGLA